MKDECRKAVTRLKIDQTVRKAVHRLTARYEGESDEDYDARMRMSNIGADNSWSRKSGIMTLREKIDGVWTLVHYAYVNGEWVKDK